MALVVADGKRISVRLKGGQNHTLQPGDEVRPSDYHGIDLDRCRRLGLVVAKGSNRPAQPKPKTPAAKADDAAASRTETPAAPAPKADAPKKLAAKPKRSGPSGKAAGKASKTS